MQLQVKKNLVPASLDLAHNLRSLGIKKLHAHLHEGLLLFKSVQEGIYRLRVWKIQRDDHISMGIVHFHAPPIIWLRSLMP